MKENEEDFLLEVFHNRKAKQKFSGLKRNDSRGKLGNSGTEDGQ